MLNLDITFPSMFYLTSVKYKSYLRSISTFSKHDNLLAVRYNMIMM